MFQAKSKITVLTALCAHVFLISAANAAPLQENRPLGLSIESMESMQLPDEVRKDFQKQTMQSNHIEQSDEKFTSLNKIVQVMRGKNGTTFKNNETPSLSNLVGEGKLISRPSSIDATVLSNATLISVSTAGVHSNGQWSGLSRIFSTDALNIVMLDENDYVSVGGRIVVAKEAINESINNAPAVLVTKKSTSGENLIQLSWVTSRKSYILSSNATDIEIGKAAMLELARGIKD